MVVKLSKALFAQDKDIDGVFRTLSEFMNNHDLILSPEVIEEMQISGLIRLH